jgi:hypothetical protein
MSMASISNWGLNFIVVFAFRLMRAGPGLAFTFKIFAVICLGGILFTMVRVPETAGLSLEAIETQLRSVDSWSRRSGKSRLAWPPPVTTERTSRLVSCRRGKLQGVCGKEHCALE